MPKCDFNNVYVSTKTNRIEKKRLGNKKMDRNVCKTNRNE